MRPGLSLGSPLDPGSGRKRRAMTGGVQAVLASIKGLYFRIYMLIYGSSRRKYCLNSY